MSTQIELKDITGKDLSIRYIVVTFRHTSPTYDMTKYSLTNLKSNTTNIQPHPWRCLESHTSIYIQR